MTRMTLTSALLPLIVLGGSAGCGTKCTLMEPARGLTLALTPPSSTGPLRIEVSSGGIGAFIYDCPKTVGCASYVDIPDYYPSAASVKITYQGRTKTVPITPEYVEREANGRGCGTSRAAVIDIALP